MARGNTRDVARAKNLKKQAEQKHKTTASGSEQAKAKDDAAAIMRAKQAEVVADAKKAAGEPKSPASVKNAEAKKAAGEEPKSPGAGKKEKGKKK